MVWLEIKLILFSALKFALILGLILLIVWVIYKNVKMTNFTLWIKYSLFKKKISEETISDCRDAIKNHIKAEEIVKKLIFNSKLESKQSKEFIYVFDKIKNNEGGKNVK